MNVTNKKLDMCTREYEICKRDYVTLMKKGTITLKAQTDCIFKAFVTEKEDSIKKLALKEQLVILIEACEEYNRGSFLARVHNFFYNDVNKAKEKLKSLTIEGFIDNDKELELDYKQKAIKAMNNQIGILKVNSLFVAPAKVFKKDNVFDEDLENKLSEIGNRNFALQDNGELCECYEDKSNKTVIIHHKSNGEKYTYDNLEATGTAGASKALSTGKWSKNGADPRTVAILMTGEFENERKREQANASIKKENQFLFLNSWIQPQAKTIDGFGLNLFNKDTYFQVSDFSKTGDLKKHMENKKAQNFTSSEVKKGMLEILSTLSQLHKKGYIHRDIKPENIIVYSDRFALSDFGFVVHTGDQEKMNRMAGTPNFLAPEYIAQMYNDYTQMEKVTNEKIDIWSLGATFFQMMDDEHRTLKDFLNLGNIEEVEPFLSAYAEAAPQASQKILNEKIDNNKDKPMKELWGIVAWMLEVNPEARPTAQEVYDKVLAIKVKDR